MALAAAAEPAAGAPLAAAVQPSTRKRRGWLSQLPTSASDTPALPPPYVELAVESPDGDVQPCLIVDPALPLRDTLLCLDLPRGTRLRLDGNRLDTAKSARDLGLAHGAMLQSFWPQAGGGHEEDEALLAADFEAQREMEAEREMPMETVCDERGG